MVLPDFEYCILYLIIGTFPLSPSFHFRFAVVAEVDNISGFPVLSGNAKNEREYCF